MTRTYHHIDEDRYAAESYGGETVIVDLHTGDTARLRGAASLVWDRLDAYTVDELVDQLGGAIDSAVAQEVLHFVETLVAEGFVVPSPVGAIARPHALVPGDFTLCDIDRLTLATIG